MNLFRCLIYLALLSASSLTFGAEFSAKVIAVMDGDTVLVQRKGGTLKIRLAEIDAPEVGHAGMGGMPPDSQKAQPFGESSRRSLSGMVLGKKVNVISQAVDQYGRMVAHISVNNLDVNAEQIRRGMAWEYSHFHSNHALIALQEEARQAPRGLWAQSNPTPPWEWRKLHPSVAGNPSHAAGLSVPVSSSETVAGLVCGSKKYCSEMASCEEARHYLAQCGIKTLDGNGDGVPCEKLCLPQRKIKK